MRTLKATIVVSYLSEVEADQLKCFGFSNDSLHIWTKICDMYSLTDGLFYILDCLDEIELEPVSVDLRAHPKYQKTINTIESRPESRPESWLEPFKPPRC